MAIKYFSGFEMLATETPPNNAGTFSFQTTNVQTGAASFKFNPTTSAVGWADWAIPAADGTHGAGGAAVLLSDYWYGGSFCYTTKPAANNEEIMGVYDGSGLNKINVRLDSAGKLSVYNNAATLVATGTTVLNANQFYDIELRGSSSASASAYELRINRVSELSGTCAQRSSSAYVWLVGKCNNRNSQSITGYWDNLYIDDAAYQGIFRVKNLYPISNTGTFQWTNTFANLDEVPSDDDTTFCSSSGSANSAFLVNSQSCATMGISGTIKSVKVSGLLRTASGTSSNFIRLNSNGSTSDTTAGATGTTYTMKQKVYNTDPNTGSAWTIAGVNAATIGCVEQNAVVSRCTMIHMAVAYDPTTVTPNKRLLSAMGIGS